jgi:hypothetical protein
MAGGGTARRRNTAGGGGGAEAAVVEPAAYLHLSTPGSERPGRTAWLRRVLHSDSPRRATHKTRASTRLAPSRSRARWPRGLVLALGAHGLLLGRHLELELAPHPLPPTPIHAIHHLHVLLQSAASHCGCRPSRLRTTRSAPLTPSARRPERVLPVCFSCSALASALLEPRRAGPSSRPLLPHHPLSVHQHG